MKMRLLIVSLLMYVSKNVNAFSFPGPQVYVVTPSPRPLQIDEGKSAPFYYHNWMRRMDSGLSTNVTSTTVPPKVKTPDLIFAEFESDGGMQKSIRKLLEKEKITSKSTTFKPIYVPEEDTPKETPNNSYDLPNTSDNPDIKSNSYMYSDYYNKAPAPVYLPSTTPSTTSIRTTPKTTTTTAPINIQNIWHIIDNEKFHEQPGHWDEISLSANNEQETTEEKPTKVDAEMDNAAVANEDGTNSADEEEVKIDDDFALPGFGTNAGNGAENESRAIRTEPNLRFPYVNLKPFQMKTMKKPTQNDKSNTNQNNLFNSLDNFYDLRQPVRGEAQDITLGQPVDRYNPAQPYLPKPDYGSKFSKQSSPISSPPRASASLVPPPPPPKATADDFPSPSSYESFPPYAPSMPNFVSSSAQKPPPSGPVNSMTIPSMDISTDSSDSSDNDDSPVMNVGYGYKAPPASIPQFVPTIQTPTKAFEGYSYNKPRPLADLAPPVSKPDFQGYNYMKPESPPAMDSMPDFQGYHYNKPGPSLQTPDHHYKKPDVPKFFDHKPADFDAPSGFDHGYSTIYSDSDYPEFIFNKHHDDSKGGDGMKGNDMGMMPPAPPADSKPDMAGPPDDHGFPSDFPGDLKFHHDIDDHDHYHYHTTTTTTTEMPRVNRYSYYYLGKKLYYLPLYFSVYFIIYVGALIIKAVLRHKIVYPNSWRPNTTTASFFSKRSVDAYLSNENLHELTGKVTHAIATAAKKYMDDKSKTK